MHLSVVLCKWVIGNELMGLLKKIGVKGRIVLSSLLILGLLVYAHYRDNLTAVVPGALYRSAQLSPTRLITLIRKESIRTVINLRGPNPADAWYRSELAVTDHLHVLHYDFAFSAKKTPRYALLSALTEALLTAPGPILLHCRGGADRTGMAVAVWLILQNKPLAVAERAYSIRYLVLSHDSVGKQLFPHYAQFLKARGVASSRAHFLTWLNAQSPQAHAG
jgi:protein tyrosine phosphatase (PTP) superfamily phosphohydrolase (DUF442 family)